MNFRSVCKTVTCCTIKSFGNADKRCFVFKCCLEQFKTIGQFKTVLQIKKHAFLTTLQESQESILYFEADYLPYPTTQLENIPKHS